MYLLKQVIGALATPLVIAFLLGAMAIVSRAIGRRRIAAWMLALAAATIYFSSIAPVGDALLGPLERQYPALREDRPVPAVGYVVVLGSGYTPGTGIPITAALDEDGLARIVEGVRITRRLGASRLLVSGGAPPGAARPARGYEELARGLGIADTSLLVLDHALDTNEEARDVVKTIGDVPFVLVTSAYHMPRAMRLMERAGAHPIPAPTGHRGRTSEGTSWRDFLPTSRGLRKTERALHEYLGLASLAAGFG